jgi:hypothetical protein
VASPIPGCACDGIDEGVAGTKRLPQFKQKLSPGRVSDRQKGHFSMINVPPFLNTYSSVYVQAQKLSSLYQKLTLFQSLSIAFQDFQSYPIVHLRGGYPADVRPQGIKKLLQGLHRT